MVYISTWSSSRMKHIQKVVCSCKKAKVPMFILVKKRYFKYRRPKLHGLFLAAVRSECKNDGFLRVWSLGLLVGEWEGRRVSRVSGCPCCEWRPTSPWGERLMVLGTLRHEYQCNCRRPMFQWYRALVVFQRHSCPWNSSIKCWVSSSLSFIFVNTVYFWRRCCWWRSTKRRLLIGYCVQQSCIL